MKGISMWQVTGGSIQGFSHIRSGLPNQDSIEWSQGTESGLPLILAVSDGHGSAQSFRSSRGSRLAVDVTIRLLQDLLINQIDQWILSGVKQMAEERLPKDLERAWKEAVEADVAIDPFTDQELARLEEQKGVAARRKVTADSAMAYGATLLSVLVTDAFILYLQLGDGDILTVSEMGATSRPLPRDERLIANETTSLCLHEAWKEFVVRVVPMAVQPPTLILLSTDGYANSYADDTKFTKIGPDYLELIRSRGLDAVREELTAILSDVSQQASGDDITLGIIKRAEDQDIDTMRQQILTLGTNITAVTSSNATLVADMAKATARIDFLEARLGQKAEREQIQQQGVIVQELNNRVKALQLVGLASILLLLGTAIILIVLR